MTANGKVKLNVDVPMELKQELKIHCAANGVNMTVLVVSLIRSYLDNQIIEKGAV